MCPDYVILYYVIRAMCYDYDVLKQILSECKINEELIVKLSIVKKSKYLYLYDLIN